MIVARAFCFISTSRYVVHSSSNFAPIWKYVKPAGKWSRRKRSYPTFSIDRGLSIRPRLLSETASCERLKGRAQGIHLHSNPSAVQAHPSLLIPSACRR